jgi:hypothetical protein
MELEDNLLFTTTQLGESYAAWKEEEKNKETDRKTFFDLAVESLMASESIELRTKVIEIKVRSDEDVVTVETRARQKHPRFIVEGVQHTGDETYKVVLKENPEFTTFTYVNEHDGMVYTRRVDDGSLRIDETRMEQEDLQLYESVTAPTWGGNRAMCPLDLMTPSMQQSVAEYIYPGPPKVVLPAPRPIKPEDLA